MKLEGYSTDFVGALHYEWDIETFEDDGEIIGHNHFNTCPGIPSESNERLVLVRSVNVKRVGEKDILELHERSWAYVENHKLPSHFDCGAKVPKRFCDELN